MKESVTNKQLAFILFGVTVGYGVIGFAKEVAEIGGTGGWVSVVITTLISIVNTIIIVYLQYTYKNKTLYDYSKILVGKIITYIFMGIYIIYFFLFVSMVTRAASEIIKLNILLKTPIKAISLLFFIVIYYSIIKGFRNISRVCEIYGIVIIALGVFITFVVFTQGKIINLRPFFAKEDILEYLKGSLKMSLPFLGMEILIVIPFSKENDKNAFKYTITMILFIGFFYIIVSEACISIIGVEDIVHYKDALMATIRRVDVPYLEFLSRIDGVVLSIWIMSTFSTMSLDAYGAVFLVNKWVKNISYNIIAFVIIVIAFIVSCIPKTFDEVQQIINFNSYLGISCSTVIPTIMLIMTKVKKRDKKA